LFITLTHTHFQTGLTALKVAQSEGGHQEVCDILLRYTQHGGAKVIGPEQELSEARQEEEVKRRESEKEGEGETNRQQQETNTQLTEVRDTCV
jgi:ribonuclease BN (tRNA processing enzyme)